MTVKSFIPILIFFALVCSIFLGCEEFNIVEPRLYVAEDVEKIPDCYRNGFAHPPLDSLDIVARVEPPKGYKLAACRCDENKDLLIVRFGNATSSHITIYLLDGGGNASRTLFDGVRDIGYYFMAADMRDKSPGPYGVYALIRRNDREFGLVYWFEWK